MEQDGIEQSGETVVLSVTRCTCGAPKCGSARIALRHARIEEGPEGALEACTVASGDVLLELAVEFVVQATRNAPDRRGAVMETFAVKLGRLGTCRRGADMRGL